MPSRPVLSPRPSPERPRAVALAALPLALLLAACGGGGQAGPSDALPSPTPLAPATKAPATTAPEVDEGTEDSSSPAPTGGEGADGAGTTGEEPEVWATFTQDPGPIAPTDGAEAFGDDPRVQVVTTFNEEFARAATDDDPRRPEWLATLNQDSYDTLMEYFGEEFGKTYPGPLPFAVLGVEDGPEEGTASVHGCIVSEGFALGGDGMTGQRVTPIEYALVQDPATEGWLVDAVWAGAYDCSTTTVEARAW